MIIDKEIISQISRDYIFITGVVDIDSEYFKKKIDEGVQTSKINYTTNVRGKHTGWKFFNNDEQFIGLLLQVLDHVDGLNINLKRFYLVDSWGLIEKFGEFTNQHEHAECYLSGVLYLNDHSQKLYFPEIKQEILPQQGRFVLFSSFLSHYTKRNFQSIDKYAISFNFASQTFIDI